MHYSNDSQGTLSIIYVDFLIMAGEKGSGRYLDFLSCQQPQIWAARSFYSNAGFYRSSPLTKALLTKHTQPTFLNQSDSGNEATAA